MSSDRLLIFAKPPRAGRVKTRLSPPLPPAEAAAVYEASLRDVIALAARERGRVEVWHAGGARGERWFAREFPHILLREQAAGDLGERLCDAFARSFADGAQRVVVIGSDAPTLPDPVLTSAFEDLGEADADVVVGPTLDGGYYLIGLRAVAWPRAGRLFGGVPWSTDTVFQRTLERAHAAGLAVRVLPGWYDVDRPDDLRRARADAAPGSHLGRWLAGEAADRYLA
jgi:rSAM/selenodomain-associated transferase 1